MSDSKTGARTGAKSGKTGLAQKSRSRSRSKKSIGSPFKVDLVHARSTHASWMVISLGIGIMLVWKLAIVGQVIGVLSLIIAAFAARGFIYTLLNPPGTINVGSETLELPIGLCRGKGKTFSYEDVSHVFFLRRAVPWTKAGPLLVVEAGGLAFTYARDWFASDSDQRRIMEGIEHRIRAHANQSASEAPSEDKPAASSTSDDPEKTARPAAEPAGA